jgi:hypothetical protein
MAIKLGDAIVFLKGDRSQLTKDLDAGEKQTKGWTQAVGTAAGQLMAGAITGGATLALGAVQNLGGELIGIVGDAIGIQAVSNTFDALTASIGTDAVTAMGQLREATRGMVADADLMQAGNKFLAMGLADTAEGAADLAEVATQLGMAMGEDATASMENFALMIANQSLPRLDSFGISSGKVRERIEELMSATEGLTREQAFNQAVMEEAQITMAKVGEQGGGAAGTMARIQTTIANLRLEIGQYFLPIAEEVLGWAADKLPVAIDWLRGQWDALQERFKIMRAIYDEYIKPPLEKLQEAFGRLKEALGINDESMSGMGDTFGKVFAKIAELGFDLWLDTIISLINGLVTAIDAAIKVIEFFQNAWDTVANIQLPDWMTPGSATPLELGLQGITSAMTDLASIGVPQLEAAFSGIGGNTDNRRNLTNYGGVQIYQQPGGGNPLEQLWELGTV